MADVKKINGYNVKDETARKITNYVSSETAIGTWIDGKTLYRQIISCTSPSTTETNTTVATITGLHIDNLINIYGNVKIFDGVCCPLNMSLGSDTVATWIRAYSNGDTTIGMNIANSSYADKDVKIVLEYTKAT